MFLILIFNKFIYMTFISNSSPFNKNNYLNFGVPSSPMENPSPPEVGQEKTQLVASIQEEIKKNESYLKAHSLLEDPSYTDLISLFKQIDGVRALVMTSLAYSALKTGYEGWDLKSVVLFYLGIGELIQQNKKRLFCQSVPPQVMESLKQLAEFHLSSDIESQAKVLMTTVKNLEIGASYTMEGGWTSVESGHVMIYRFERTSKVTFNIYVYNGNGGAIEFQGSQQEIHRSRVRPYMLFKDVKWEELFFCSSGQQENPIIFKNLLLLLLSDTSSSFNRKSLKDVLGCFAHLQHRYVLTKNLSSLFISVQPSGNCPVKSTNCLLLDLLQSSSNYKLLSLEARLAVLIGSFHTLMPTISLTNLFQLKEATRNFLRLLNTHFSRSESEIKKESYVVACATAHHILKKIEEVEQKKALELGESYSLINSGIKTQEPQLAENRRRFASEKLKELFEKKPVKENSRFAVPDLELGLKASWNDLSRVFSQLKELMGQMDKEPEILFQIEGTLRNLSPLKSQANELRKEEALSLLKELADIQQKYNEQVDLLKERASPAAQNTAMEFLALSYSLAVAADKEFGLLKDYAIYTKHFFESVIEDRLFAIQDVELLEQRQQLELFFSRWQAGKTILFNFKIYSFSQEDFVNGKTPEGELYRAYIHASRDVKNQLERLANKNKDNKNKLFPALYQAFDTCWAHFNGSEFPLALQHLKFLMHSTLYTYDSCGVGELLAGNFNLGSIDIDSYPLIFKVGRSCWSPFSNRGARSMYQEVSASDFLPEKNIREYVENTQSNHLIPFLIKENSLLIERSSHEDLPFDLALAEPDVQTSLLLSHLEEHLERLESVKFRMVLGHMFIKNVKDSRGMLDSPFIHSLKDPLFLLKFERLVKKSQQIFIELMPKNQPKIQEILFITRLYAKALQTVCQLHSTHVHGNETLQLIEGLVNFLKGVSELKTNKKIKHEILLAQAGLLLGIPFSQISEKQQVDLFIAFFYLKQASYN